MKKIYILTLLLFGLATSLAQTTVYYENFGTPSGTTAIASHTFQNTAPIAYSGTADVRSTQVSLGYTGASGAGNVFFTSTAGRFLLIEGINTSAYPTGELSLSFGMRQEGNNPAVPGTLLTLEYSTDGILFLPLSYERGANSTWELVTVSTNIPSAQNLRLRFTQTATTQYRIDDLKITAVSATCLLDLGADSVACDAVTAGIDTYTATIPFTGGGLAVYNIIASDGTITGDNPSTTASGNILITGINENTDITVTITGGTCNYSRNIMATECKPINTLPYYEGFDYTAGNVLGYQQMWSEVNSGDSAYIIAGGLTYPGVNDTGNSVSYGGAGAETYTPFTTTTTGTVYASFLMNITDMANLTTDGTQSYIVALTQDQPNQYNGRLWIQKNGAQYKIGISTGATATNYTSASYNVGDVVMIIMGFDYADNTYSVWVNPNLGTFTPSTPATLTETVTTAPTNFGSFLLRQDSDTTTPAAITLDELRIATSLSALSVNSNQITGFAMYPNPVYNTGLLNITSDSNNGKQVEIYNMLGKQVINTMTSNNTVNVSALTSGIYMVKVTEDGKTATQKLVVQ